MKIKLLDICHARSGDKGDAANVGLIAREEVITKSQDPSTVLAKLQELELAQAMGTQGPNGQPAASPAGTPAGRR